MDKLELDTRVARLERSVATLKLVVALALIATAGILVYSLSGRPVAVPSHVTIAAASAPPNVASVAGSSRTIETLEADLRKLYELRQTGAISTAEYDAKKRQLLDDPLTISDFKADTERAQGLRNEGILSSADYDSLKRRILDIQQ